MAILTWINGNGIIVMVVWGFIILVAGTIPPLPSDAGFWAKWAYAFMKGVSLNARGVSNAMQSLGVNIKLPEMNVTGKKKEEE